MRPADKPQAHIAPSSAQPGRVVTAIGSGTDPYSITPDRADDIAERLAGAAAAARAVVATGR